MRDPAGFQMKFGQQSSSPTGAERTATTPAGLDTVGLLHNCFEHYVLLVRHGSHSSPLHAAGPDNYSVDRRDPIVLPDGYLTRLTTGPCFDAEKGVYTVLLELVLSVQCIRVTHRG